VESVIDPETVAVRINQKKPVKNKKMFLMLLLMEDQKAKEAKMRTCSSNLFQFY